nr:MAG TPA: hypothetical protein [Caudoviricetes sp.]
MPVSPGKRSRRQRPDVRRKPAAGHCTAKTAQLKREGRNPQPGTCRERR